jgi:hypothetical protein
MCASPLLEKRLAFLIAALDTPLRGYSGNGYRAKYANPSPTTKLRNYPTTKLTGGKKDSQTIVPPQLRNYETTELPNYQTIPLPNSPLPSSLLL